MKIYLNKVLKMAKINRFKNDILIKYYISDTLKRIITPFKLIKQFHLNVSKYFIY